MLKNRFSGGTDHRDRMLFPRLAPGVVMRSAGPPRRRGSSAAVPLGAGDAAAPRARPRRRLCRFVHLCLRALAGSSGFLVPDPADLIGTRPPALPPGHPERLIPHVPPTAQERLLWAQLAASPVRRP
jgi:hypothetical protein